MTVIDEPSRRRNRNSPRVAPVFLKAEKVAGKYWRDASSQ
jgi:hypothetical protein